MKASKILFNIATVICFLFGALYIFTLVFIPIGIYCFIAAKRFQEKAEHLLDNYAVSNKIIRNYAIFASIACFPLGLVSLIAYFVLTSNNVKVSDAQTESVEASVETADGQNEEAQKPAESVEAYQEETKEEKQAKFEKLKKFHEKGIITDDELETAKVQLFGKEDK